MQEAGRPWAGLGASGRSVGPGTRPPTFLRAGGGQPGCAGSLRGSGSGSELGEEGCRGLGLGSWPRPDPALKAGDSAADQRGIRAAAASAPSAGFLFKFNPFPVGQGTGA